MDRPRISLEELKYRKAPNVNTAGAHYLFFVVGFELRI